VRCFGSGGDGGDGGGGGGEGGDGGVFTRISLKLIGFVSDFSTISFLLEGHVVRLCPASLHLEHGILMTTAAVCKCGGGKNAAQFYFGGNRHGPSAKKTMGVSHCFFSFVLLCVCVLLTSGMDTHPSGNDK
jgi:hypothetical protein